MRPLSEIKGEIALHRKKIEELETEFHNFQKACPHPDAFVTRTLKDHKDYYNEYDHTMVDYKCAMCEGTWGDGYDKKRREPYTLKQVITGDYT